MSKAPKAGTPVIVDVVARTSVQGRVAFSHRWRWEGSAERNKGRINIPSRGATEDPTSIHFHLKDETNPPRNLVFVNVDDGPIWLRRGSCPGASQPSRDPQFPNNKIRRSPHLLKVVDSNSEACTIHYRLRFIGRTGRRVSYDPEIKNGGTNAE